MHVNAVIHRFLTHDSDFPLTYGLIVDRRMECGAVAIRGLNELANTANQHPDACAYGKIAVVAGDGIHTFQATSEGFAIPVFCGNSTAAAIKCLGGRGDIQTVLHGADGGRYRVAARIEGDTVLQTWTLAAGVAEERQWRGRSVLILRTFNDYAIVPDDLPDGMSAEAARIELLGPTDGGKLAIVKRSQPEPIVEFYNANGRHGAAPQTGLATIALGARSIDWLRDVFSSGQIAYETRAGLRRAAMPRITDSSCGGLSLGLRGITVNLTRLPMGLAA